MTDPILELTDIEKGFFGIPVLQKISLTLHAGQTLGLLGENGAGKSTLMNILGGNLAAGSGHMKLSGEIYAPGSPRDAEAAGVAFIHQELNLFANLSIAENLFLTHFPRKFGTIDRHRMRKRSVELLKQVGLSISPSLLVETLSAGERQLVEIAKALNLESQLIILDEPTTSLTEPEVERLFGLIRSLQQRGITLIYISHALGEVRELCDEVVVLRDGNVVARGPTDSLNTNEMVSLMVGRQVDQKFPASTSEPSDEVVLDVRSVSQPGIVENVSFSLHRGEVLGIAGLMGSGRTELARILFGCDPMASGEIELHGVGISNLSTRERIGRGMAMLTESRRDDGLCMPASIRFNMSLVSAKRYASALFGWLHRRKLNAAVDEMGRLVKLTGVANLERPVRTLSGGNQQKSVLAKWLANEPTVLILDEPTRGIDVGAKYEIYGLIDRLAIGGAGVVVISSEIEELIGLCDRILVMRRGEIHDELSRREFDRHRILHSALHGDSTTGAAR